MNTIYRTIKRVMIIAACLPMSIGAVSIALVNNTDQPLTIISTGATLAQGAQHGQDIGGGYTPLLRTQNKDVIGVEIGQQYNGYNHAVSTFTVTIEDPKGFVLESQEKKGGTFAGIWSITEDNEGSLQLNEQ